MQYGYWGFHTPDAHPDNRTVNCPDEEPPLLTPASVEGIQNYGGTVLGSDRGGNDTDVIVRFLKNRGINQVYIIGGDGTHRGAHAVSLKVGRGSGLFRTRRAHR